MSRRWWCSAPLAAALAVAVMLASGGTARAQSDADKKAAKKHFEQGKAFQNVGKLEEAIKEYEQAYVLAQAPPLLFNLAQAYRQKGDNRKALEIYQRFLSSAPADSPGRDEAKRHIGTLKLKIELEDSEAARKRAEEDAAAARKRAEEEATTARKQAEEARRQESEARARAADAEAARRRADEAEAARRRNGADEDARIRRLAEEMEAAARRHKVEEAEAYQVRMEQAGHRGHAVRVVGAVTMLLGVAVAGLAVLPVKEAIDANSAIKNFNNNPNAAWTTDLDQAIRDRTRAYKTAATLGIIGGGTLVCGFIVYRVGAALRNGAEEEAAKTAPSATLSPWASPTGAGLALGGTF